MFEAKSYIFKPITVVAGTVFVALDGRDSTRLFKEGIIWNAEGMSTPTTICNIWLDLEQ